MICFINTLSLSVHMNIIVYISCTFLCHKHHLKIMFYDICIHMLLTFISMHFTCHASSYHAYIHPSLCYIATISLGHEHSHALIMHLHLACIVMPSLHVFQSCLNVFVMFLILSSYHVFHKMLHDSILAMFPYLSTLSS